MNISVLTWLQLCISIKHPFRIKQVTFYQQLILKLLWPLRGAFAVFIFSVSISLEASRSLWDTALIYNMCVFGLDMLRVSEGQGTRLPKTRAAQRSTLTSVLQFLGNRVWAVKCDLQQVCSVVPNNQKNVSEVSRWSEGSVYAAPVWCLFQSPVRRPMRLALTAPQACRRLPLDASSLLSHTAPTACWENAATTTTAGLSQTGAQVLSLFLFLSFF